MFSLLCFVVEPNNFLSNIAVVFLLNSHTHFTIFFFFTEILSITKKKHQKFFLKVTHSNNNEMAFSSCHSNSEGWECVGKLRNVEKTRTQTGSKNLQFTSLNYFQHRITFFHILLLFIYEIFAREFSHNSMQRMKISSFTRFDGRNPSFFLPFHMTDEPSLRRFRQLFRPYQSFFCRTELAHSYLYGLSNTMKKGEKPKNHFHNLKSKMNGNFRKNIELSHFIFVEFFSVENGTNLSSCSEILKKIFISSYFHFLLYFYVESTLNYIEEILKCSTWLWRS